MGVFFQQAFLLATTWYLVIGGSEGAFKAGDQRDMLACAENLNKYKFYLHSTNAYGVDHVLVMNLKDDMIMNFGLYFSSEQ